MEQLVRIMPPRSGQVEHGRSQKMDAERRMRLTVPREERKLDQTGLKPRAQAVFSLQPPGTYHCTKL